VSGDNLKVKLPFEFSCEEKKEHREEEEKEVCANSQQSENSHGGNESTQSLKDTVNDAIESEESKQEKESASDNTNESKSANVSESENESKKESESKNESVSDSDSTNESESESKSESENESMSKSESKKESENDNTNENESNNENESANESESEEESKNESNSESKNKSESENESDSTNESESNNDSESENESMSVSEEKNKSESNSKSENESESESENTSESESENENENENEVESENEEESENEDSEQQQFSYQYNTDEVVKINIDYVALHYQTAFQRFIERIAEEETKAISYDNENSKYNVKKLMFRQYEKKSLNAYKVSRIRESIVLILDTSGSMDWWAKNLSIIANLALRRRDVEIFVAPNGYIEYQHTLTRNIPVNHEKLMSEWKERTVIYVGDFDGADTPVFLSQNNNVIYVCPETRYRHFASHDWVHYSEKDFKGVFIRVFDIDEMFIAFRMITRLYKMWIDLHEDAEYHDDEG